MTKTIDVILVAPPILDVVVEDQIVDVVIQPRILDVVGTTEAGPRGPVGPPGGQDVTVDRLATVTVSGHRAVAPGSDGHVGYADNTTAAHRALPVGITLGAAVAGDPVNVRMFGRIDEPSWTWTPGQPVFLGTNGVLTQTAPTKAGGARFLLAVGTAETATVLFVDPQSPITL